MKGLYNLLKFRQLVCEGARISIQVIYSQREKRSKMAGQLGGEKNTLERREKMGLGRKDEVGEAEE